jgi:hypothetical protein
MKLHARINRLEATRPKAISCAELAFDLPADTCARIAAAQAAGTYPQSLSDEDLMAIVAAADKKGASHD